MNRQVAQLLLVTAMPALIVTSCAHSPIEEIARDRIRAKAKDALNTYTQVIQDADHDSVSETKRRLEEAMPGLYSVASVPGEYPTAYIYLRDHITTSGGFWGEQRTVSACVRYSYAPPSASMHSIECPATGPQSEYSDERIAIP